VQAWQAQAREGGLPDVVLQLLTQHYDPIYTRSMQRNFSQLGSAPILDVDDGQPATLAGAALRLMNTNFLAPAAAVGS
jgi:tRNA 2-selenouridine synthase